MITRKALAEARWMYFVLRRRSSNFIGRLKRVVVPPRLPSSSDGVVRVHLGCGNVDAPGFINVDLKAAPHVHFVHSVTSLPFLDDSQVDLIYACHVLEHFPMDAVQEVLWEWKRVLKEGGVLRISVPDFDKLLKIYNESGGDVESVRQPLMGVSDGYNSHLLLFNFAFAKRMLQEAGFSEVRVWQPEPDEVRGFKDWSTGTLQVNGKAFPISLNVEAVKGRAARPSVA